MNTVKQVLLLNGSPKANGGTSGSMIAYLRNRLRERGCVTEALRINQSVASEKSVGELLTKTAEADILVLAFPLYIDSLPYPVTKALELIADRRKESGAGRLQHFLAIANNGFPETHQNDTALAICRLFTREVGFTWTGGLALGGGQSIDGRPLEEVGWLVRNVKKSLDLAADALAEGRQLPEEAVRLMAKPLMPTWLYLWMGETGGKRKAKKNRVWEKINDRPYSGPRS